MSKHYPTRYLLTAQRPPAIMLGSEMVSTVNGKLTIMVTETPVFVVPVSGNYVKR